MDQIDWALLILRLGTGLVILAHGVNHARGRQRTTAWFGSIGFQKPELQWLASTVSELAVGVALVIGLLTAPAAAGLVAVMAVAFWSVHRKNGFFIFRPGEGWEYVATLAMNGIVLAVAGPGTASLDHVIGLDSTMSGGVGALLIAAALVAAAVQLAIFFRPPAAESTKLSG
ncbi:MAG: DoxX family protein [Acidimicrobiia bacterium]|nr:DoxX family protein [Acidimicrobiia bacterium]